MLDALGGCVECANADIMNAMMVPSCLMGPMYGIMRNNREWLGEKQTQQVVFTKKQLNSTTRCPITKSNKECLRKMQVTFLGERT